MSELNLKNLVKESATIKESFPGYDDFIIEVCYPGRKALNKIRESCMTQKLNRTTKTVESELDEEKFLRKYTEAVIKGWTGLTISNLQEIALVDVEGMDPEQEIPFNLDNAVVLMENSPSFDSFITELSTDFENFTYHK